MVRKHGLVNGGLKKNIDSSNRTDALWRKTNLIIVIIAILGFFSLLYASFLVYGINFNTVFLFIISGLLLIIASKINNGRDWYW